MKKLWIILSLMAVLTACSDDNKKLDEGDPFSPVTGLYIPLRADVGTQVTLQGKGFASDCEIWLQRNGGGKLRADVIQVDNSGVVFAVSGTNSGFYVIILVQGGKEYRIGGINLVATELEPADIEAYAVRGEMAPVVYPVSITGKTVGQPLFEMRSGYYFGTAVSSTDGKVYYSGFDSRYDEETHMTKMVYYIDYYDAQTGEKKGIPYARVNEYFAMGLIDNQLHLLLTADQQNFDLVKLSTDGTETRVHTYNLAALAGKIWSENLSFVHDPQRGVIYLDAYLKGSNPAGKTYILNLNTGEAKVMDGGSKRFSTVLAGNEVYFFCRESVDDDMYNTTVWHPVDPLNWSFNDPAAWVATLTETEFSAPFYNPEKNVFYGIGEDEVIYTWDLANPTTKPAQWVKSGCEFLFTINNVNN